MILCAGEALIDMLPRRSREGERAFAPFPGGAVFNTAIALGRLGAPSGFFCGLSRDLFGEMLTDALAASEVDHSLCARSGRPTTLAFVTLSADGQARYAFYDENTALRMLAPGDLPQMPEQVEALFFGGISLVGEPCGSAFEALMAREAGRQVTMIDPNIRPGFITDEPAYRARIGRMLALADIVKVSDEDLDWLAMSPEALIEGGAKLVCLTEGARGVTVHGPAGSSFFVPAREAEVVDTVGAGDTFNAGLLAGLHEAGVLRRDALAGGDESALRPAIELGVAAAAVTVSRAGANPPWREELA